MKKHFLTVNVLVVVIAFSVILSISSCLIVQPTRTASLTEVDANTTASPVKSVKSAETGKKILIRGTVVIFGNEPHSYAGIRSEDGKITYAVYPHEKELEIWSLQGKLLDFTVLLLDRNMGEGSLDLKAGTVTPLSWKIVN